MPLQLADHEKVADKLERGVADPVSNFFEPLWRFHSHFFSQMQGLAAAVAQLTVTNANNTGGEDVKEEEEQENGNTAGPSGEATRSTRQTKTQVRFADGTKDEGGASGDQPENEDDDDDDDEDKGDSDEEDSEEDEDTFVVKGATKEERRVKSACDL